MTGRLSPLPGSRRARKAARATSSSAARLIGESVTALYRSMPDVPHEPIMAAMFEVPLLVLVVAIALVLIVMPSRRIGEPQRICRNCGAAHPPFANFCRRCGSRL